MWPGRTGADVADADSAARRETLARRVARLGDELIATSHRIHRNPELQYEEHETAAALCDLVERHAPADGVLERGAGGLPTAFRATRGPGDGPRIAFVAEYDALPDIGHGCGHNIIGTAAVAAFLAACEVVDDIGGTVEVIGTPAEEGGGGKVLMLDAGVFDDVDLAIQMHPSWETYMCPPLLGMESIRCAFRGVAAHGGQAPHLGRSALAGVIQTFNAVDTMRHHLHQLSRVHGIITDGGRKPSVIPDHAACHFFVRAPDQAYQAELAERVRNCARGAALATGTTVEFLDPEFPAYEPFLPSPTLTDTYRRHAVEEGWNPITLGEPVLSASNDIGNVSRRIPAAMMMFGITGGRRVAHHSREFAEAAATSAGERALIGSAVAMASTAAHFLADRSAVSAARHELAALLAAEREAAGTA
jgi:amidohydrolase